MAIHTVHPTKGHRLLKKFGNPDLLYYIVVCTYTHFEKPTFSFLLPDDKMSKYLINTKDLMAARLRNIFARTVAINGISQYIHYARNTVESVSYVHTASYIYIYI